MAGLEDCSRGIARSADGGKTWQLQETRVPGVSYGVSVPWDVLSLASAPSRPLRVYAITINNLLRSDNGGITWTQNGGIRGDHRALVAVEDAIAVHPRDSNLMLASSLFVSPSEGIASLYRSVDGGATWMPGDAGIEGTIRGLTFSADGTEAVAAGDEGVFRSTDGGLNWQRVEGGPAGARAIAFQGNGILRVGTNEGVFSSVAQ
ncbi:MAG: hypothetical protein ABIS20_18715 [Thermoanaerobaculia bacterium]